MKYDVIVTETAPSPDGHRTKQIRCLKGVSLPKAWSVCNRAARRGVRLFGGQVDRQNWGAVGGQANRTAYRAATIYPEGYGR